VLYELLTGRRPFEGETWQDMIIAINRDTAKPPSDLRPDLPPDVDRLLAQCMAKSPKDRYPSIRELMEDIDRVLAGAGVFRPAMPTFTGALPPPAGPVITGPPSNETHLKTKPRALLFVVAGLLAVAAIAAGVLVALGRGSAEGEPASAASITATADPIAAPSPPPTATAAGAITETPTPSAQPEASAQVEAPAPPVKGPPRADRAAPPPPASASAKPKNPILGF
jgi:serine/threonine-protein kinase